MNHALVASGIVAGYARDLDILRGVTVHIEESEIVAIVGPNGAGKSTLVKVIMGLVRAREGDVSFRGQSVSGCKPHELAHLGMGYVPQRQNVFPSLTIEENLGVVCVALKLGDTKERLERVLTLFPRLSDRLRQQAGTLSGGERQMLALARVLLGDPGILILDEPSAGLAPSAVDLLFEKVVEINSTGVAVLVVEQNARRALALSSRGYVLDVGEVRYEGVGRALATDPTVEALYLGGLAVKVAPSHVSPASSDTCATREGGGSLA